MLEQWHLPNTAGGDRVNWQWYVSQDSHRKVRLLEPEVTAAGRRL